MLLFYIDYLFEFQQKLFEILFHCIDEGLTHINMTEVTESLKEFLRPSVSGNSNWFFPINLD